MDLRNQNILSLSQARKKIRVDGRPISYYQMRRLCISGAIASTRIGGRQVTTESAVAQYLAQRDIPQQEQAPIQRRSPKQARRNLKAAGLL